MWSGTAPPPSRLRQHRPAGGFAERAGGGGSAGPSAEREETPGRSRQQQDPCEFLQHGSN